MIEKLQGILLQELNQLNNDNLSIEEKLSQGEVIYNMYKVLRDYDKLEPLLKDYFNKNYKKQKWGRDDKERS